MGELIARVLAIGAAAAVAPVPIVIVLVMLASPRGLGQAWRFTLGYSGSLLIAGALALLAAGASAAMPDSRLLSIVGLVLGLALLAIGARYAIELRRDGSASSANVRLTELGRGRSAGLGIVAGALNPKTLPIFLTGVAAIALGAESAPTRSLALALLTAAASAGVALPPLLLTLAPSELTTRALARVRIAGERHAPAAATLLILLTGLAYAMVGLAGLR